MSRAYNAAVRRLGVESPPFATQLSKWAKNQDGDARNFEELGLSYATPLPSHSPLPHRRQDTSNSNPLIGGNSALLPSVSLGLDSTPTSGPSAPSDNGSGQSSAVPPPSSQIQAQSQSQSTSQTQATSQTSGLPTSDTSIQTSSSIPTSLSSVIRPSIIPTTQQTSSTAAASTSATTSPAGASSSSPSTSLVTSTPGTSTPAPSPTPTGELNVGSSSSSSISTSSGILTTIYSTVTTNVNGQPTTFTTAIPTTLPDPSSSGSSGGSNRAIITGSAIGGTVFVIIVVALVIFLRRSDKIRMNYKKLRVFGRGRRSLLEDEDEDDWLGDAGLGTTTQYRDYPASVASSSRPFSVHNRGTSASGASHPPSTPIPPMQEFHAASPLQSSSPYLMGMRAASSGSIFHESVWPPPNEGSRFVDPLVQGSSQVDLTRIVPDVMGPDQQTRTVIYGTPVVVGDGSVAQHGRPISQAGLLSYPSGPASPTATTATHQTTFTQQTTYTTQTAPSHHPMPSHSLRRSWERAQNQPINESLYDPNRDIDCGNAGSPVVEPQQMRLVIKNAEPLSPLSPTPVEPDQSFAQAQAKRESVISGSPRWLDRQIRKE